MNTSIKVGIVQDGPVYFDKNKSVQKAKKILEEAGKEGVNLLVFGESWLSGYPVWLDYSESIARWDDPVAKKIFRQMFQNSIQIPGKETKVFSGFAKKFGYNIVLGCNEVVGGTIYNAVLTFSNQGEIVNHHRKLMPTFSEKMVYGIGDGAGLRSVDTPFGKLTASICWEHWMPLTRHALHQSGETVHVALWPNVHEMLQVCSRHYAFEGRCFVIAVGQMLHRHEMPEVLQSGLHSESEWLLNGGSCVIDPAGNYILEPQHNKKEMIFVQIDDLDKCIDESMTLDVSGHYARPDVFHMEVNQSRLDKR
jgi:predicted amidohydrolase